MGVKAVVSILDQLSLIINGLVLLPLYLRYVGAEAYGYWLATGGILAWLGVFNLATIVSQRVASSFGVGNHSACANYYWGSLWLYGVLTLPVAVIGVGSSFLIPYVLGIGQPTAYWIVLAYQIAVLGLLMHFIGASANSFLQSVERPNLLLLTSAVGIPLQVGVVVFGLLNGWNVVAIPAGLLAQNAFKTLMQLALASWYALALNGRPEICRATIRDILHTLPSECLRILGKSLGLRLLPTIITLIVGPAAAVAFDVTTKAAQLVQVAVSRFMLTGFTGFSNLLAREEKKPAWKLISETLIKAGGLLLIGVSGYLYFNESFVALWVGAEYFIDGYFTHLFGTFTLLYVFAEFYGFVFLSSGDIRQAGYIEFTSSVSGIMLSCAGLVLAGINGLPIGLAVNYTVFLAIYLIKLKPDSRSLATFGRTFAVSIFAIAGLLVLGPHLPHMDIQSWFSFTAHVFGFVAVILIPVILLFGYVDFRNKHLNYED